LGTINNPAQPAASGDTALTGSAIGGGRQPMMAPEEAKWYARLVGAGSLLTLLYEVAFLALNKGFWSLRFPWILVFHAVNIGLFAAAVILTLNVGAWMRAHWKQVAFAFSSVMIASSTAIAILTSQTQPLFIALMLFLAGTGPFLSWGERAQALLTVVAFLAFGITIASLPNSAFDPYQVVGILIAAAIGLFSTALERRLRRARWHAEAEVLKGRETLLLQERLRLAGQLASGIAHDLNNTLNVVKLRLSALSEDELVKGRHKSRLQALDRAIEDAARTVARVRELGKAGEDDGAETVQLCEIIAQAVELARSSIEGKPSLSGVSIQILPELPEALPPVKAPASDLRQVFLNLFLNAADALQHEGEIKIDSIVEDAAVMVRVSDNGTGIPAQHIERIFEPFFTTKGALGTGLGLSTASETMTRIGGSITASNRSAGGAVFTLRFPLATPRADIPELRTAEPARDASRRFLLIDDDNENLASLREFLVRDGHVADTAHSGEEAIAKLRTAPAYDVILCDLGMPGMNGWEVARAVRQIAANADFYIITGWGRGIERQIPPSVSVSGVLSKPVDLNELRRIAAHRPARARQLNAVAS
jgi:signal transduction histidine kinase/ActR/RegA family two-component response regulator